MTAALSRLNTHDPADSAFDLSSNPQSSLTKALRHALALRHARPFSSTQFCDRLAPPASTTRLTMSRNLLKEAGPMLRGKHIAYLRRDLQAGESGSIAVYNLVTGESQKVYGQAREKLLGMALSLDVVAIVTYTGLLYVASLSNVSGSQKAVRLPSSSIAAMEADRTTVVCLLRGNSETTACIFEAQTQTLTSCPIRIPTHLRLEEGEGVVQAMLVSSTRQTIDIFQAGRSARSSKSCLAVSRFSFSGEHLAHATWESPGSCSRHDKILLGPLRPTGRRDIYQINLICHSRSRPDDSDFSQHWPLFFHSSKLHWCDSATDAITLSHEVNNQFEAHNKFFPTAEHFLWKDKSFGSTGPGVFCIHVHASEHPPIPSPKHNERYVAPDLAFRWPERTGSPHNCPQVVKPPLERCLTDHSYLMNDTFLVLFCYKSDTVNIASFDERVELHNASPLGLWDGRHPQSDDPHPQGLKQHTRESGQSRRDQPEPPLD